MDKTKSAETTRGDIPGSSLGNPPSPEAGPKDSRGGQPLFVNFVFARSVSTVDTVASNNNVLVKTNSKVLNDVNTIKGTFDLRGQVNASKRVRKTQQMTKENLIGIRPRSNSISEIVITSKTSKDSALKPIIIPRKPKSNHIPRKPESNHITTPDVEWTTVQSKKRSSPETTTRRFKQSIIENYWLGPSITTSNRYTGLDHDTNDFHQDTTVDKVIKPPPVFIAGVSNIQPLVNLLEEIVRNGYEIKILREEQVKVQAKNLEVYTKITKELITRKTKGPRTKPMEMGSRRICLKLWENVVHVILIKSSHGNISL